MLRELMSVGRKITFLQLYFLSKHFGPRTYFRDLGCLFSWLLELLSNVDLDLRLRSFPFVFKYTSTFSTDFSSHSMTCPKQRSLFLFVTWTIRSMLRCPYKSSIIRLSNMMIPCITLIVWFMIHWVHCYSSLICTY